MPEMRKAEAAGPSWARADWPPVPNDDLPTRWTGQWAKSRESRPQKIKQGRKAASRSSRRKCAAVLDSIRALMIIRAYRIRGHLIADLDPLGCASETASRA